VSYCLLWVIFLQWRSVLLWTFYCMIYVRDDFYFLLRGCCAVVVLGWNRLPISAHSTVGLPTDMPLTCEFNVVQLGTTPLIDPKGGLSIPTFLWPPTYAYILCMTHCNQILHGDQIRWEEITTGSTTSLSLPQKFWHKNVDAVASLRVSVPFV